MDRRVLTYKGSEHVKIIHRPYILNKKGCHYADVYLEFFRIF